MVHPDCEDRVLDGPASVGNGSNDIDWWGMQTYGADVRLKDYADSALTLNRSGSPQTSHPNFCFITLKTRLE